MSPRHALALSISKLIETLHRIKLDINKWLIYGFSKKLKWDRSMRVFILVVIIVTTPAGNAKAEDSWLIKLYTQSEAEDAHMMNSLISQIPSTQIKCLDGEIEENNKNCQYSEETFRAGDYYCKLKIEYPLWKDKSPNYTIENDTRRYALDMATTEKRLGKFCGD